ncbi:hypothetical protein M2266_000681 [Streptomyces sp. SPB162]|nr:hypothetical protein [Streptomyces sp. SPB162]
MSSTSYPVPPSRSDWARLASLSSWQVFDRRTAVRLERTYVAVPGAVDRKHGVVNWAKGAGHHVPHTAARGPGTVLPAVTDCERR